MEDVLAAAMVEPLRLRFFLGLFSLLGVVLGTVGVYGIVSYTVQRRHAEYGVRMALGARPADLVRDVVLAGMVPVVAGVVAGGVVAWLASSVLAGFLFEVEPTDPVSLASASVVLLATGVAAALVPALRAARTDPAKALRD
jgi:ABC-type antimicrobial peptide transport system permease subunit